MELYKELLVQLLSHGEIHVTFSGVDFDPAKLVEAQSYLALQKIKAILEDDQLDDADCFSKIEAIVSLFEDLGSSCGSRHDFG